MSSLTGQNNSLVPAFAPGMPISSVALNRLAQGYEMAKTTYSDGVLYQGSSGGVSYVSQPDFIPLPPANVQQFQVNITSDTTTSGETVTTNYYVQVAKGLVVGGLLIPYTDNTNYNKLANTNVSSAYFAVNKFAVFQTGQYTSGTDTTSPYVDDGGKIKLPAATIGTDAPVFEICLIRNPYAPTNNEVPAYNNPGYPYLAVIEYGTDADSKTQPFDTASGIRDDLEWVNFVQISDFEVDSYEPGSSEPIVYHIPVIYNQETEAHLYNYNCSRLVIANVEWDKVKGVWVVDQKAIGTLALPLQLNYKKTIFSSGTYTTDALYGTQQDAWYGGYSGYTIDYQDATEVFRY